MDIKKLLKEFAITTIAVSGVTYHVTEALNDDTVMNKVSKAILEIAKDYGKAKSEMEKRIRGDKLYLD